MQILVLLFLSQSKLVVKAFLRESSLFYSPAKLAEPMPNWHWWRIHYSIFYQQRLWSCKGWGVSLYFSLLFGTTARFLKESFTETAFISKWHLFHNRNCVIRKLVNIWVLSQSLPCDSRSSFIRADKKPSLCWNKSQLDSGWRLGQYLQHQYRLGSTFLCSFIWHLRYFVTNNNGVKIVHIF